MNRYDREVSNLSYTNKDFNSIYNELLDLADRISPKWKPSQSNESDPGALLIKLDALVGDKNNYNIDKNILELFPSSVTQYPNAREVFEQCGYIMPYYRAADVIVSINMTSEPEGAINTENSTAGDITHKDTTRLYTIPDFTMLTNDDNSIVYTIIDRYPFLTSDRVTYNYTALQGSIKDYTLNNSLLITYNSLDYNNRLYFKEPNIAENGIFITNVAQQVESKNYSDWIKVDNILTQAPNTLCYKFGVSKDGSKCYIEFPTDIANLIGEGLHIKYITTSGYAGNISDKVLTSFFGDIKSSVTNATNTLSTPKNRDTAVDKLDLTITNDNVYIRNVKASTNGRDPQTLDEARVNYERTKNTFETLVSLRDYNNFLLNSDQVSNGFICDRSNDIQASTKIVTTDGNLETIHTQVKLRDKDIKNSSGQPVTITEPELSAFDLKIYALKYVDPVNTETRFDLTFDLADSYYLRNLKDDMSDIKCIQHDFKDLNENEIIMIQLKYPIYAKIIPYNRLETLQQLEIQSNIRKALFESLNSGKLSFGEEVDYDSVYDIIMESDNRIKSLILDDFDYTAHIIYRDGTNINSYEIPSEASIQALLNPKDGYTYKSEDIQHINWLNTIKAKAILAGVTPLLEKPEFNFNYSYLHIDSKIVKDAGKVDTICELTLPIDDQGKASIRLRENESIYLTTNNYITKETYTNYVKYFYKLKDQINPNELHELTDNEYVAFFWKESDEDESYYYTKFKKDSSDPDTNLRIISPSFSIKAGSTESNFSLKDSGETSFAYTEAQKLIDGLTYTEIPSKLNSIIPGTFKYPNDTNPEKEFTASELIAKCDTGTILSGAKSIQIKDKNSIDFNPEDQPLLYWVRNNSENKPDTNESVYYLFKDNPTIDNKLSYTLKTGEYLFYSDKDGKTFSMLGPGTKLECDAASGLSNISVKARTYEEILYGANNLLNDEGLWYIPTQPITAYEMMFYNIGAESTINFDVVSPATFDNIYTNAVDPNTPLHIESSYIKIDNNINIYYELESSISTNNLKPEYEFEISDGKNILMKKSLADSTISYTYQDSTIELPKLSISDAKWSGRSYLNLNCGPNNEQTLYNETDDSNNTRKHFIIITKKLDKTAGNNYTFVDSSNNPSDYPKVESSSNITIQSNYNIEILGGEDIDVTAFDLNAVRYNNAFYTYKKSNDTDNVKTTSDYVTEINLTHSGNVGNACINLAYPPETLFAKPANKAYLLPIVTLKDYGYMSVYTSSDTLNGSISHIDGKYTLDPSTTYKIESNVPLYANKNGDNYSNPVINPESGNSMIYYVIGLSELYYEDTGKITIKSLNPDNKLETINNSKLTEKGIKFFVFTKSNTPSNIIITVKNKEIDSTKASKIRILPIVPYLNEGDIKLSGSDTTDKSLVELHEILKSLDSEHKFNYIHEVKSDVLIENPWDPYSFLDKNHPYNHATICRWDYDDSTIKITNKIK